jgi:hypothetical protein
MILIYSVRLSVHEDVTPQGVNLPLQLLLSLNHIAIGLGQGLELSLDRTPVRHRRVRVITIIII